MAETALDFRNANSLWGSVMVETLVRLGLRQAVIAPGSRSAPLAFALAQHRRIEAIPVLDERSAAFFALGLARQHRRATALVCTSGTAAANFLPAVIEARESGVPLLVLTADRPPELRHCAAGQAIDQQKLYGGHVAFSQELPVPEARVELLRAVRQAVAHAFERTQHPFAGPVHLNVPFRDPLAPTEDGLAASLQGKIEGDEFFAHLQASPATDRGSGLRSALPAFGDAPRGVIVAGPAQPPDARAYVAAVARLASVLGWPVLADGLNPLRPHSGGKPFLVADYTAVLRSAKLAERLKPEAVICLGEWPTGKPLRQWIEAADPLVWLVNEDEKNHDAVHARTRHLRLAVEALAAALPSTRKGPTAFAQAWRRAGAAARRALDSRLSSLDTLFEGKASWLLARRLPAATPLFIASSMPVRDVECFWPPGRGRQRIYFNRGANGIDGTLSTALGLAHGNDPAVLLTGDLALLHDTNGFLLRPKLRGSLTVVLINNRGGGIFEMLPVADFDPPFEAFFATPQEADFFPLCAAYGAEHVAVRDWEHFTALIGRLPKAGIRVLELRTDRKRDAALRRELLGAAAEAAETAVSEA